MSEVIHHVYIKFRNKTGQGLTLGGVSILSERGHKGDAEFQNNLSVKDVFVFNN